MNWLIIVSTQVADPWFISAFLFFTDFFSHYTIFLRHRRFSVHLSGVQKHTQLYTSVWAFVHTRRLYFHSHNSSVFHPWLTAAPHQAVPCCRAVRATSNWEGEKVQPVPTLSFSTEDLGKYPEENLSSLILWFMQCGFFFNMWQSGMTVSGQKCWEADTWQRALWWAEPTNICLDP